MRRPLRGASDSELLELCLGGGETAWEELVIRYQGLVFSTALEVGLGTDDAGDVFQEVWAELYRSLRRIRHPDALARWLMVATRRASWKVAVRSRRVVPDLPPDLVDPWALPDEAIEFLEARTRIEEALGELGEPCATVLRLLFLEDPPKDYREIATAAGVAIGTIGSARARCMTKLRRILRHRP
ncbi:MAG: sigma-70 family RNA polymerase sigma factor [Candidatus Eisenbacteria bacterium]|uniref:Sigma-70 family RNA polymerase sigma factor n=1 Tax=Eiseniibacteriota bacterium TaxID=2212470 RepID=A0A956LXM8_UNCEI|nr:sigma-70 family RNA polymerase sigma factor [Candidatus Eisenbacteria bacterium]